ncbi:MAG TPA: hypothetical protein VN797_07995, partial [Gemmatimonadaceae bacterium]|nr:hypothetical protein [Gemmatimonadaceae bacterium]
LRRRRDHPALRINRQSAGEVLRLTHGVILQVMTDELLPYPIPRRVPVGDEYEAKRLAFC